MRKSFRFCIAGHLAGCKEPSGLAFDQKNRRLFSVCGNKKMMVVNADTGKVVATPAIGEDPDAAGFDPDTQLVFSSNGESGDLTVIHEDSPDKYAVVETVPTKKYARTMAIDFEDPQHLSSYRGFRAGDSQRRRGTSDEAKFVWRFAG